MMQRMEGFYRTTTAIMSALFVATMMAVLQSGAQSSSGVPNVAENSAAPAHPKRNRVPKRAGEYYSLI